MGEDCHQRTDQMTFGRLISRERNPRHTFIAVVVMVLACAGALALELAVNRAPAAHPIPNEFGDSNYPVIFAGTSIYRPGGVRSIEFFTPLFGARRQVVNPATPEVEDSTHLRFEQPGEYYLRLNRKHDLKVLVLDPEEAISDGVLRIFDFLVANLLVSDGEQPTWYRLGKERYAQRWFRRQDPGLLLCGPTDQLFRMLVYERFRLPSRMVTLSGIYRRDGQIIHSTHNVPEIYLPDVGKFVMFDLNFAFTARWLNAIDLAYAVHAATDDTARLTRPAWNRLALDVYMYSPRAFRPKQWAVLGQRTESVPFGPDLVSSIPVSNQWVDMMKRYYGGIVYRGPEFYGTGFLPADYNVGLLHRDPELRAATIRLVQSYEPDATVAVYSLPELERMLEAGFRDQLDAKAWRTHVPRSVLRATDRKRRALASSHAS